MQILVLEDDASLRFALKQILQEAGHTAHEAGDIETACDILDTVQPDVLLMDLMIGHLQSTTVADLAAYRFPDADVVYLTGTDKFPRGELFDMSPNTSCVFRKPVDFRELKAFMAHLAGTGAASAQIAV